MQYSNLVFTFAHIKIYYMISCCTGHTPWNNGDKSDPLHQLHVKLQHKLKLRFVVCIKSILNCSITLKKMLLLHQEVDGINKVARECWFRTIRFVSRALARTLGFLPISSYDAGPFSRALSRMHEVSSYFCALISPYKFTFVFPIQSKTVISREQGNNFSQPTEVSYCSEDSELI